MKAQNGASDCATRVTLLLQSDKEGVRKFNLVWVDVFFRWVESHSAVGANRAEAGNGGSAWSRPIVAHAVPSPITVLAMISAFGVAILIWASGLHLDPTSIALIVGLVSLSFVSTWAVGKLPWRHEAPLRAAISATSIFAALALTGAMASYPVAALTSGYHDATLHRIDQFLGFDWVAAYSLVAAHPSLQVLGVLAYRSIYLIPLLLLGYWAMTNQQRVSNRFLFEFWLAVVVTLVLFVFMPAQGAFAYLWQGSIPYMPDSQLCQPQLIPELRIQTVRTINMGQLCGLVSAPSFHAAAAVLYFRSGFRAGPMKWPVLLLSTAMLISTPVEGTHYLIDILIGMAVAAFVLSVVQVLAEKAALTPAR